MSNQLH